MSEDKIFLIRDGELQEMRKEKYDEEEKLQQQIEDHTGLLPGEQIDPDATRRWLMIERESGIQDKEDAGDRWSVDHLLLDQDGIPTLIEVKRQQDTRTRRRVVAQMLDYAANTSRYWTMETIKERFRAGVDNPEDELAAFLNEEASNEEFWEDVETNLERGKIRLLFVADDIPSELKSIVEFLNNQMKPAEVLAIELGHYEGQGEEALVPRVIGQTEAARQKKSSSSRKNWDWSSMLEHARDVLPEDEVAVIEELYEFAQQKADDVYFGTGSANTSFMASFDEVADTQTFKVTTAGEIGFFRVPWLLYSSDKELSWGEEEKEMLEQRLSSIIGEEIDLEENAFISLGKLTDEESLQELKETIIDFVNRCGAS